MACSATFAQGVEFVAFAIACTIGQLLASTFVHRARTVAHTTCIQRANAVIHVVAYAICIRICQTIATAYAQDIKLVAVTIAVTCRQIAASAFEHIARTVTNTAYIVEQA